MLTASGAERFVVYVCVFFAKHICQGLACLIVFHRVEARLTHSRLVHVRGAPLCSSSSSHLFGCRCSHVIWLRSLGMMIMAVALDGDEEDYSGLTQASAAAGIISLK